MSNEGTIVEQFSLIEKGDRTPLQTDCNHFFHFGCLKEWVDVKQEKTQCPICRHRFKLISGSSSSSVTVNNTNNNHTNVQDAFHQIHETNGNQNVHHEQVLFLPPPHMTEKDDLSTFQIHGESFQIKTRTLQIIEALKLDFEKSNHASRSLDDFFSDDDDIFSDDDDVPPSQPNESSENHVEVSFEQFKETFFKLFPKNNENNK